VGKPLLGSAKKPRKPRKTRQARKPPAISFRYGSSENWALPWGALASPIVFPKLSRPFFLRSAAVSGTFTAGGGSVAFAARLRDGSGNLLGIFGSDVAVAGAGDTYSAQIADSLPIASFLGGATFTCVQGAFPPSLLVTPQMTLDFFLALTTAGQTVDIATVAIEYPPLDSLPSAVAP